MQNKPKRLIKPFGICFGFGFWAETCCKSFSKAEGEVQQPVRGVLALHRSICLAYRSVINCLKWPIGPNQQNYVNMYWNETLHWKSSCFLTSSFWTNFPDQFKDKIYQDFEKQKHWQYFHQLKEKNLYNIVFNVLISSPEFSVTASWVEISMRSWLLKKRIQLIYFHNWSWG